MKLKKLKIADEIQRRVDLLTLLDSHKKDIGYIAQLLYTTINSNGRVFVAGDGPSSLQAGYLTAKLVGSHKASRPSIDIRNLSGDPAILSTLAYAFHRDQVFSRQIRGQFQHGDIALFYSSNATPSAAITTTMKHLSDCGNNAILIGRGYSTIPAKAVVLIGSDDEELVQESHLVVTHILLDLLERKLQQEPDSRFVLDGDID